MRTALTIAALAVLAASGATTWASAESLGRPSVLMIEVHGETDAQSGKYMLTCRPNGGDHPQVAAACRRLNHLQGDPFRPVPPGTMCTMIYGGPQRAHIEGIVKGRPVAAEFNRTNGCEIHRWDSLVPVLPAIGT